MIINTLSNALVNTKQELWLVECHSPCESSAQVGLPGSLQPCAETLACEDDKWLATLLSVEECQNDRLHTLIHSLSMEITRSNKRRPTTTGSGGTAVGRKQLGVRVDSQLMRHYENPRSYVNDDHPADRTGFEVNKLCTSMKTVAKQSRNRPNQILTQALLQASDQVRANSGIVQTCKRDLQRQHCGCLGLPQDTATLQEVITPVEWKDSGGENPRPFLLHSSGSSQHQRVIVCAAEEQLRHLGPSDTWFMDGNYTMSQSFFK